MSERIPSSPPVIPPVAGLEKRPFWSVMIPAYNCGEYLRSTLQSVLTQDPGTERMQIEVVDDCSTESGTAELVRSVSSGRVAFFRQPENRGSLRNFETCLKHSTGEWIHLLHGDDMVNPGFYSQMERLIALYPDAGAIFSGFTYIDEQNNILRMNDEIAMEEGVLKNWLTIISEGQRLQPPSIVVKRSVYEDLGGFFGIHYGEDWEMWVRIASKYPMVHTPMVLAQYRVHNNNISSRYFQSGQHIADITMAINTIRKYLPELERRRIINNSKRNWSHYFARTSDMTFHRYHLPRQALKQAWMAFKMHQNKITLTFFVKIWVKKMIGYKAGKES